MEKNNTVPKNPEQGNCDHKGTVYCLGVGPGDPELVTLKAIRLMRECDVIAVPITSPDRRVEESVAYGSAVLAEPEIAFKKTLAIELPMTRDRERLEQAHQRGAERLEEVLDTGANVAYLLLGDPTIYGSFAYLSKILTADGYLVQICSGVPSFCAAAARAGISLVEGEETLRIVPGPSALDDSAAYAHHLAIMKAGSRIDKVKVFFEEKVDHYGNTGEYTDVCMVENCGMENEHIYRSASEIPEYAGYLSIVIAKARR